MTPKSVARKKWIAENPEKYEVIRKRAKLKWHYGITLEEFNRILEKQGGRCAICGTTESGGRHNTFHVDHCHGSNRVRGLLCLNCNRGIGYFHDNVETLKNAAKYLRRFK